MPFINDQLLDNQNNIEKRQHNPINSRFKFNVDFIMGLLRSRIIGQPEVIEQLENMLITLKADFSDPNQPLAVVLLTGPTGVGKTETVRVICEAIYQNADALCRIDMNTLAQEHYSAALLGAPPGYVGSKEGHTLLDQEKIKGSFSKPGIVLLDEIEKADKQVCRSIMNILDTGKLSLTSGQREIDFTNSIIFMTSNIGGNYSEIKPSIFTKIYNTIKNIKPKNTYNLDLSLRNHFDAEFINRINYILQYSLLTKEHITQLIEVEIERLNSRLKRKFCSISITSKCKKKLAEYYDEKYGVRDIKRILKQKIEPLLARHILNKPQGHYVVDWDKGYQITDFNHEKK